MYLCKPSYSYLYSATEQESRFYHTKIIAVYTGMQTNDIWYTGYLSIQYYNYGL